MQAIHQNKKVTIMKFSKINPAGKHTHQVLNTPKPLTAKTHTIWRFVNPHR